MMQPLKLAGPKLALVAVLLSVAAGQAAAQEKLKIGVIVTLSGPAAALGAQVRDGFALGVKDLGGKMAGREVEVVVVDDELKPDAAKYTTPRFPIVTASVLTPFAIAIAASSIESCAIICISSSLTCRKSKQRHHAWGFGRGASVLTPSGCTAISSEWRSQ